MKKGDVLVEKYSALTFYTVVTSVDGNFCQGIRTSIDYRGKLYDLNAQVVVSIENVKGVLLALPDELPLNGEEAPEVESVEVE